jgi:hypothetical protein
LKADLVIVGDLRFPGGTSTSIAAEVAALAAAGYRIALVPMASPILSTRRMFHPEIAALVRDGAATVVRPGERVQTGLCCLHHPAVFEAYPAVAPRIHADETLLIVHHPPVDGTGAAQYSVEKVCGITGELFGAVTWAPVGPAVRSTLLGLPDPPAVAPKDWVNVIDVDAYARPARDPSGRVPVLGRHSRPDPVKWPASREAFLGAYPDDPEIRVRLMGWDERLDAVVGERPMNWELLKFNSQPVPDFLAALDYFSYFHGPTWIEAFGRSILEAMAAGVLCLLPPHFSSVFHQAGVYCESSEVADRVRAFQADPASYASQTAAATALVRERYGPEVAVARVRERLGPATPAAVGPVGRHQRPSNRVLFITSNGIGMGHLTRALAIARRLGPDCEPIVVTMSKAFGVARDLGMHVEYLPYFLSVDLDEALWTASLQADIREIVRCYRPNVVAFDGNVPYDGLMAALAGAPEMWRVWIRRAMWRPSVGKNYLARAKEFDVVIEPGEIARSMDRGPTASHRGSAREVPPIRMLDRGEMLTRQAAREALGLKMDEPAALLLPGSGNNFDVVRTFRDVAEALRGDMSARPVQVVLGEWMISNEKLGLPVAGIRLSDYPFSRFLNAFDVSVAMAGYNTFHENVFAGLPTLFLSNENPKHDDQGLRAEYGALRDLCLAARPGDAYAIPRALEALLSDETRSRIRQACGSLPQENGASVAAAFLAQLSVMRKPHSVASWSPVLE